MKFKVKKFPECYSLPTRESDGAAGLDLYASCLGSIEIWPGSWSLIGCGFAIEIPEGYEGQIRPRSGMALKRGLTVLNAPGTIDYDYRGEVGVILQNVADPISGDVQTIKRGDRIAQLVIAPVQAVSLVESAFVGVTDRNGGGFGSTGQ